MLIKLCIKSFANALIVFLCVEPVVTFFSVWISLAVSVFRYKPYGDRKAVDNLSGAFFTLKSLACHFYSLESMASTQYKRVYCTRLSGKSTSPRLGCCLCS